MFQYDDLIGTPWVHGGRSKKGFDCYGLVEETQRRLGRVIPNYSYDETHAQIHNVLMNSLPFWTPCEEEPGAVAAIRVGRFVSHVATVLPFGKMIHCWEKSGGVCVERISDWQHRIVGYYKFPQ